MKTELLSQFLMNRIGKPKDAANLIGFLANKDAEWIADKLLIRRADLKDKNDCQQ